MQGKDAWERVSVVLVCNEDAPQDESVHIQPMELWTRLMNTIVVVRSINACLIILSL